MQTKSKWNHAHGIRNGINAPPVSSDTSKLGRAYGVRWNRRIASAGETSPPLRVRKNNGISK